MATDRTPKYRQEIQQVSQLPFSEVLFQRFHLEAWPAMTSLSTLVYLLVSLLEARVIIGLLAIDCIWIGAYRAVDTRFPSTSDPLRDVFQGLAIL